MKKNLLKWLQESETWTLPVDLAGRLLDKTDSEIQYRSLYEAHTKFLQITERNKDIDLRLYIFS